MARALASETLTAACADYAAFKKTLQLATASPREVDRIALTHALTCPTCKPLADHLCREHAARTERLAREARAETVREAVDVLDQAAKVIEANGFCKTYLWDTKQAGRGTPIEQCRVDMLGAIAIVLYGSPTYAGTARVRAVERLLTDRIDAPSLAAWCSYPGNGQTEAVELLRATADALCTEAAA